MDECRIQKALGKHLYLQNICIPNVLMYQRGKHEYEADLIYFGRKSNYLTEVEIKISIQDFRADLRKATYHDHPNVRNFYYAIPSSLYEKHKDEIEETIDICNAGLILIDEEMDNKGISHCFVKSFHKKAKPRKNAVELTENEKNNYLRIGCMKWVGRY